MNIQDLMRALGAMFPRFVAEKDRFQHWSEVYGEALQDYTGSVLRQAFTTVVAEHDKPTWPPMPKVFALECQNIRRVQREKAEAERMRKLLGPASPDDQDRRPHNGNKNAAGQTYVNGDWYPLTDAAVAKLTEGMEILESLRDPESGDLNRLNAGLHRIGIAMLERHDQYCRAEET